MRQIQSRLKEVVAYFTKVYQSHCQIRLQAGMGSRYHHVLLVEDRAVCCLERPSSTPSHTLEHVFGFVLRWKCVSVSSFSVSACRAYYCFPLNLLADYPRPP